MLRNSIKAAQISSMKSGDKPRLAAVRLILAKLKDRDIELRTAANAPDDDTLVVEVLQKMVKQRRESIDMYTKGGRDELAAVEAAEVAVIEEFLPKQMSDEEIGAAIDALVAETGAASIKEMGKVMALIKERHAGELDMSKASQILKAKLS